MNFNYLGKKTTQMKKRGGACWLFILFVLPFFADAQSFYAVRRERSLIAIGGLGTSSYFGDFKNDGDYLDAKPTISIGLQQYLTNRISLRSELTYFSLKGNDSKAEHPGRRIRNLSFVSNNFELNVVGMVNLFPMGRRFYQRPNINFYGFAGIALMYMNPKADTLINGKRPALQPLQTEDVKYSRFQPVIPYGLGMRIKAGPFFNVSIEGGWRLTFTDYMDDVSTVYPDMSTWTDPIRIALADRRIGESNNIRGNPDNNDNYYLLTLKVEFYLPYNFLLKNPNRKLYNSKRKAYYR